MRTIGLIACVFIGACGSSAPAEPGAGTEASSANTAGGEVGVAPEAPATGGPDGNENAMSSEESPPSLACRLETDFNRCIVTRLEGRAESESELIMLIQSYRMLGDMEKAREHMSGYVDAYPDGLQAQTYRDYLAQH